MMKKIKWFALNELFNILIVKRGKFLVAECAARLIPIFTKGSNLHDYE
jgi:hypothetical protein